jgi:hypothetical protein
MRNSLIVSLQLALRQKFQNGDLESFYAIIRVIFCCLLLFLQPPQDISELSNIDPDAWTPPIGPFLVFDSPPTDTAVWWIENSIRVLLVFLLVGFLTRFSSITLSTLLLISSGLKFSTGKIDHDILLILLPFFLAKAWGGRLSVKPEKYVAPRLNLLAACVGFFFLSSSLFKLFSGWLHFDSSATANWLNFYELNYGFQGPFATTLLEYPTFALEALDWVTVILELAVMPLLLFAKTRKLALVLCFTFNIAVMMVFGIDFIKLAIIYFVLVPVKLNTPSRVSPVFLGLALVATALQQLWDVTIDKYFVLISFSLLFGLLLVASTTLHQEFMLKKSKAKAILLFGFLSLPFLSTSLFSEPYPAILGPSFRGLVDGNLQQQWFISGTRVSPEQVFNAGPVFSQNLAFFHFPAPTFQGHEFRQFREPTFKLPDNVELIWIEVDR